MNYLITGGTGLIGRALSRNLLAAGHSVTVLSRRPSQPASIPGVKVTGWDARTPNGWERDLESADAVIHLAGENIGSWLWTKARKARILSSRVETGRAIIKAIEQADKRPSVLYQASGIGYYGTSYDKTFREGDSSGSNFDSRVAVEWEASTQPVEEMGVRRVIGRMAIALDAREGILPIMALPFKMFVGGPLGNGKQWVSWIHRDDVVRIIRFLVEDCKDASGVFNVSSPQPLRNAEFGKILGRALHRPYWFPTPAVGLRLVLGEMSQLVLEGQKVMPERLDGLGYQFMYPTLQDTLESLYQE